MFHTSLTSFSTKTRLSFCSFVFFFNDTATTEIYTLSLHDALPISRLLSGFSVQYRDLSGGRTGLAIGQDRKSTRLNSSHQIISYAVFCLKKKKTRHAVIITPDECL